MTLSGVVVHESDVSSVSNAGRNPAALAAANKDASFEPVGSPALRRFHQNSVLEYDYVIYNASLRNGVPQLQTRISISRGAEHVLDGEAKSFDAAGQTDLKRLNAGGRVLLGERLPPGEYVLKIIVTDLNSKRSATQFINFEIVK